MYLFSQKIMFKHCDPAGIVFYPKYFEIINDTVEEYFDNVLGLPFSVMHPHNGIPTAQIEANFSAPSRLGDRINVSLDVQTIGRSSMTLRFEANCEDELRFSAKSVLVYVDENGQSIAWPETLRHAANRQHT